MRLPVWLGALVLVACGGSEPPPAEPQATAAADPGQVHIHGLGVNPADGSVLIATHTGLFRAAPDSQAAERVGDSYQDTMGFAIVGPDHFLGSGHPDPGDTDQPPYLGLIESKDAGETWQPISLHGEVDFHVLESSARVVYGYGSDFATGEPRFLTSSDGGRTWDELQAPEPLISLALMSETELVASGQRALHRSDDGGKSWERLDAPGPGHLTWTDEGLVLLDLEGQVHHAREGGSWRPAGSIGGQPAAFDEGAEGELLAALHDGSVVRSADQGRTWALRAR